MHLLDNLINVITACGNVYSYGSKDDELLYHVDALDEFVTIYNQFNLEDDFYERINLIVDEGNILFLSTSYDDVKSGNMFLPYEITDIQKSILDNFDFLNANINVIKGYCDYGFTNDFNINNYMNIKKR